MSNVQRVGLAVVAGALVGLGVWLVMSDDAPAPGPGASSPAVPSSAPASPQANAPVAPTTDRPVATAPTPAVPSAGGASGAGGSGPQVEFAPSPFESADSAELQYAAKLVLGETTGPAQWLKAAEVFQRCVDQNPTNHFCRRGVRAAWERLDSDGGQPTSLMSGVVEVKPGALVPVPARADGLVAPTRQERLVPNQ